MNMGTHPARVIAAVAAVIAAGTTTVMALTVGTATADEPGRCTQNVNVREQPDTTSRIVAMCKEGTEVVLGTERDNFVRIDKLGGWASKDFVTAGGTAADTDGPDAGAAADDTARDGAAEDAPAGDEDAAQREDAPAGDDAAPASDAASPSEAADAGTEGADDRGATGASQTGASQTGGEDAGSADSTTGATTTPAATPRRVAGIAGMFR